ncbi:ABC transporter permease [candidate division KSB1 bacterium]
MKKPPKIARRILSITNRNKNRLIILGDFEEFYNEIYRDSGALKANIWYWKQALKSVPVFLKTTIYWSFIMFMNYLKITFRNFKSQKGYSFINIAGFAVGIACSILILLWIYDELNYDSYHENADRICRVGFAMARGDNLVYYAKAPFIAAKTFSDELPEIESYTRILVVTGQLSYQDKKFDNLNNLYAEPAFFEMFSYNFINGNAASALYNPGSVVLTEETAFKIFGKADPVGKIVKLNQDKDFVVTGVIKNVPVNSHFHFDFVVPIDSRFDSYGSEFTHWRDITGWSYVLLEKGADIKEVEKKIPAIVKQQVGEDYREEFFFQKLTDIHLKSNLRTEIETNGDITYVYLFSVTALLILIIACINFMNLSTARSAVRMKEVGLRKVLGANRRNLIRQFLGESIILTTMGILFAVIIVIISLPVFNEITKKEFNLSTFINSGFLLKLLCLLLFTGIISGSYPAFYLSSFKPAEVLRARFSKFRSRSFVRNILAVSQFVITLVLITCTFIMIKQINYMKNKDLGFEKENIIVLRIRGQNIISNQEAFKNELKKNPAVLEASYSSGVPGKRRLLYAVIKETDTQKPYPFYVIFTDPDFLKTFKFNILYGRDFSKDFSMDVSNAYVVNETAAKQLGFGNQETIGKRIMIGVSYIGFGPIVGVIKDFNFEPLKKDINPLVICPFKMENIYLSLKIDEQNTSGVISFLENKWKEFEPNFPFDYFFVDENFNSFYMNEERTQKILNYFSVFAVFISCLGLFGLASFTVERRTKEIGIRKVLGAKIPAILLMLLKKYIAIVVISTIIAAPGAFFAMKKWLENFAFKTNIGIFEFILSAAVVLLIVLSTVSYQAFKAASANPVKSLRNE